MNKLIITLLCLATIAHAQVPEKKQRLWDAETAVEDRNPSLAAKLYASLNADYPNDSTIIHSQAFYCWAHGHSSYNIDLLKMAIASLQKFDSIYPSTVNKLYLETAKEKLIEALVRKNKPANKSEYIIAYEESTKKLNKLLDLYNKEVANVNQDGKITYLAERDIMDAKSAITMLSEK